MEMTKTKSQELIDRRKAVVPHGVGLFNTATVEKAHGATITDADGRELIDFAGGIGVVNAGHTPQPVIDAIVEQVNKYIHVSFNVVTYEPYVALCEKLTQLFPHGEQTKAMLVSTGAEAVENVIKIARQATGRPAVISYTGAFHGRTMMAMSLTSKVDYKLNCGPFAPEVYRLPYPNYYRYGKSQTEEQFVDQELKRLHESSRNVVAPSEVAAVIVEIVQGEGGFNVMPERYLQGLREYCDKWGIVLIFDEVQSGFGRTGKWGAYQHFDVTPDLSTWAKSMGSGMPIAAVVGKAEVMDAARPGTIGGTYIGNPVSCAAALATIKYMEDENLNQRGVEVGQLIRQRFERMKEHFPAVGDVRGLGAMMAMELVQNGDSQQPDQELTHQLVQACAERGLILLSAGTHKNIIRVLSPLVIEHEILHQGLNIIEEELEKLVS